MERLTLAYGGLALNFLGGPNPDCLGCAGLVYEYPSEEKKFTFDEKLNSHCPLTLLIKGPNKHTLTQIKDAIRDGLRAVKNAIDDGKIFPVFILFSSLKGMAEYCVLFVSSLHSQTPCKSNVFPLKWL